jgi:hypothetical protein
MLAICRDSISSALKDADAERGRDELTVVSPIRPAPRHLLSLARRHQGPLRAVIIVDAWKNVVAGSMG